MTNGLGVETKINEGKANRHEHNNFAKVAVKGEAANPDGVVGGEEGEAGPKKLGDQLGHGVTGDDFKHC